jgi:stage II sporulation protein D
MKKTAKTWLAIFLTITLFLTSYVYQNAAAYTPTCTTLKVGIFYGSNTLPSANLQNVTGYGSGYQFGIMDSNRQFVPVGAVTAETKITMLRDRNMVYDADNNEYDPGLTGSVVVGCFHIQLNNAYSTYADALAAVSGYSTGFVKYSSGNFYACVGNYVSADDAAAAITANGITKSGVTSGTSSTVTVVKTGTNKILFEFEYGSLYYLVVMPVSPDGTKCRTWFKGYKYYGSFQYPRFDGENLTVLNCVNIEDYTKGVIPYEMANTWPLEALKAQAVCARTYAIANIGKHTGFDVCTTQDCQVYSGISQANAVTDSAVDQTAGQYLTYNGQLCITYYTSSDGGATENSENVWPEMVPYLRGVSDPYEEDIAAIAPGYAWTVEYSSSEITARLQGKGYNCGTIVSMAVTQYTDMGNVYKVTLTDNGGKTFTFTKGESIRLALGTGSIRFTINGASPNDVYVNDAGGKITGGLSSASAIGGNGLTEILGQSKVYAINGTGETSVVGSQNQVAVTSDTFVLQGTGHGHNIGMSQWGAYSMAKFHAMTYDQILKFYFTGTKIE